MHMIHVHRKPVEKFYQIISQFNLDTKYPTVPTDNKQALNRI